MALDWTLVFPLTVHLEFRFNLRSVLLDFQLFPEKPVLTYLIKNSMDRVSDTL